MLSPACTTALSRALPAFQGTGPDERPVDLERAPAAAGSGACAARRAPDTSRARAARARAPAPRCRRARRGRPRSPRRSSSRTADARPSRTTMRVDARAEAQPPAVLARAAVTERVGDALRAAARHGVAAGRRRQPEHVAERRAERVVRPDVDVQRERGASRAARLALEPARAPGASCSRKNSAPARSRVERARAGAAGAAPGTGASSAPSRSRLDRQRASAPALRKRCAVLVRCPKCAACELAVARDAGVAAVERGVAALELAFCQARPAASSSSSRNAGLAAPEREEARARRRARSRAASSSSRRRARRPDGAGWPRAPARGGRVARALAATSPFGPEPITTKSGVAHAPSIVERRQPLCGTIRRSSVANATKAIVIVLGIDPGTRRLGWGVVAREGNRLSHVAHGVSTLAGKPPLAERLALDRRGALGGDRSAFAPTGELGGDAVFHKDAQAAAKLGHARGVVLLCCARAGVEVAEYAPARVKRTVAGHGAADKRQVALMVRAVLVARCAAAERRRRRAWRSRSRTCGGAARGRALLKVAGPRGAARGQRCRGDSSDAKPAGLPALPQAARTLTLARTYRPTMPQSVACLSSARRRRAL